MPRPAAADGGHNTHVLIDESVDLVGGVGDLDVLATEDGLQRGSTSTDTLSLASADGGETSDGVEEVTEGGQVAALALGNVLLELIGASGSVSLEGQVVVGDLLVVTLDHLEELVTSALDTLGDRSGQRAWCGQGAREHGQRHAWHGPHPSGWSGRSSC